MARNFRIDIAQHWILAKSAHAHAIHSFCSRIEPRIHHGLRRMPVGNSHTLAKTVIERVIQVKDHTPDDRLGDGSFFALETILGGHKFNFTAEAQRRRAQAITMNFLS